MEREERIKELAWKITNTLIDCEDFTYEDMACSITFLVGVVDRLCEKERITKSGSFAKYVHDMIGDVLACNEEILLFKSYSVLQGRISLYCWYNGHTNNFHSKEVIDILLTTRNKVCPATKEQRDALMKAMNDAGYEWDAENKKLKKEKAK